MEKCCQTCTIIKFTIATINNKFIFGAPIVAQWVKDPASIHEDVSFIPGLIQWVKDLALPQDAAQVMNAAQIWHCHGCGIGL